MARKKSELLGAQSRPCQIHAADLIPDWCEEVFDDVAPSEFKVKDIKYITFVNEDDTAGYVDGPTMRLRTAERKANFGLSDVKTFLVEQADIPSDMRGRKYIVFSGTVLRDRGGFLYVSFLGWRDDGWVLCFRRLGLVWDDCACAPCK